MTAAAAAAIGINLVQTSRLGHRATLFVMHAIHYVVTKLRHWKPGCNAIVELGVCILSLQICVRSGDAQ
jgi:hypothetical protein